MCFLLFVNIVYNKDTGDEMKIVIEGMDGVGKSTVAKEIAYLLNAKYVDGLMINFFQEQGMTEQDTVIIKKLLINVLIMKTVY